jgi:hypothetical protein
MGVCGLVWMGGIRLPYWCGLGSSIDPLRLMILSKLYGVRQARNEVFHASVTQMIGVAEQSRIVFDGETYFRCAKRLERVDNYHVSSLAGDRRYLLAPLVHVCPRVS